MTTEPKGGIQLLLDSIERFNVEVVGLDVPAAPTQLGKERKEWTVSALLEEANEFKDATTMEDEVDALIDLSYFALGRLIEMGVSPIGPFMEVHSRNMAKKRGELSKRPGSMGHDAVKPEGWTAPDIGKYVTVDDDTGVPVAYREQMVAWYLRELLSDLPDDFLSAIEDDELLAGATVEYENPSVLVIGHARHGKDTVSEMLRDRYGLTFSSSSGYCADRVIWPILTEADVRWAFVKHMTERALDLYSKPGTTTEELEANWTEYLDHLAGKYVDPHSAWEDRVHHRAFWYEAISWFNSEDPASLARGIFGDYDVYAGVRNPREFWAIDHADLADHVVWVDASDRVPEEDPSSMGLEPWMAHTVIDNNGTVEDLERAVDAYAAHIGLVRKEDQ